MTDARRCPKCDAAIPADSTASLCPKCLLALGFESQAPGADPTTAYPTGFVPPPPQELERLFPQLEIIELLGRGGMGAVYKARQKHLDRLVAVKILPPDIGRDLSFAERFSREAKSLARLNHPSIVAVYDFGDADGLYYFVMEYVDGANLRRLIESNSLSPSEALAIVPQICDALQFAHDEGIVHRDIKPENVLVDRRGRVKIADFGLAKLVGRAEADHSLTGTNQVMGTPHYMAPEQVEDPQHVDHRADIYSLGVVFYEMLTGELPIGRFAPPSKKVQIDVRLDEVVLKALEKEPEQRYQRASEVKTEIEGLDQGESNSIATWQVAGGATGPSSSTGSSPDATVPREVKWPAIGLMVTALLNWFGMPFMLALLMPAVSAGSADDPNFIPIIVVVAIVCLFTFPAVMLVAGLKMKRLDGYWLAIVGSVMAIVISPGSFFIGLPIGMWSLVVLCQREVRSSFAHGHLVPSRTHSMASVHARRSVSETSPSSDQFFAATLRREVKGPAIGLIVTAIFAWLGMLVIVPTLVYLAGHESAQFSEELMPLVIACMMLFPAVMLVAGLKMKRLEAYWLAVAGSVLAMVTSPGSLIGFPIGIWSLLVLSQRDVKAAFRRRHPGRHEPENEMSRRPRLVPVFATLNLVLAVVMMLMLSANDPMAFPETTPAIWRLWGDVEAVLGFVASVGLFTASVGLYLRKPWARKLALAVCVFGLVSLVIDMPYLTRAVLPSNVEDLQQSMIADGISEEEAEGAAMILVAAFTAVVLIVGLTWLIGQLVYFTRPKVIAAFEKSATEAGGGPTPFADPGRAPHA